MLELLLVLSLLGNGWQFYDKGSIEQSNKQLEQVVIEQEELIEEYYSEKGYLKEKLIEAEREREKIYSRSEERARELEELRNSVPVVRSYLDEQIPESVVEHLRSYRKD